MAHLQEIIITSELKGRGNAQDPERAVTRFWSKDGVLLAETDPMAPQYDKKKSEWVVPKWMKTRVGALKH